MYKYKNIISKYLPIDIVEIIYDCLFISKKDTKRLMKYHLSNIQMRAMVFKCRRMVVNARRIYFLHILMMYFDNIM